MKRMILAAAVVAIGTSMAFAAPAPLMPAVTALDDGVVAARSNDGADGMVVLVAKSKKAKLLSQDGDGDSGNDDDGGGDNDGDHDGGGDND